MSLFMNVSVAALYAGCIAISYCIFVSAYLLYYHPLNGYPGPLLARVSDSYAGFYAIQRKLHLATYEDHKRYGNVIRYGPNRLIFNTPTALKDIYQNPRVTKSRLYLFALADGVPFLFNFIDRDAAHQRRKIIDPFFSFSEPINLTNHCSRLGIDIATSLGFGYCPELQTKEDNRFVRPGISVGNYRIHTFMNFPFLSKLRLEYIARRNPLRRKWRGLVEKLMKARLAQEKTTRHDYYSYVMESFELKPDDPQQSGLFAESLLFMSAGGDTVATAMAALFFYLSRNQGCYDKLSREIRSTFKTSSGIRKGPLLSGCLYLRACIDEALRMSPPIGGTPWRQLADGEDDKPFIIDGHVIPQGTHVGVNAYSIHHNEDYFPEPFTFKPERWMPDSKSTINEDDSSLTNIRAFAPFSLGTRACPGKAMAYFEASLVMAKTLWYFDFQMCSGSLRDVGSGRGEYSGEYRLYDMLTSRHDGPYLNFKPRDEHWKELVG
ncbi:cytochrome P450 [Annulohypoxylon nitens]|nr:cytochrome P450 [Annulohypoxylon nitens]